MPTILSVQVGAIAPLGPNGVLSGYIKRPIDGRVRVSFLNLAGDAQADLTVHGGVDKAVYAYAVSRYSEWIDEFPEHRSRMQWGAFGENLSVSGMDELDLCIGDVHEIGTAQLQVCQPRQPCFKFALRFDDKHLPNAMFKNQRSGWYYRVLKEGELGRGDTVRLVERPNPDLPFSKVIALVYRGELEPKDIEQIAHAQGVAQWIKTAALRELRNLPL